MASNSKSKAARPLNLAKLQETKSTIRFSAKLFRPAPKATEKMGGLDRGPFSLCPRTPVRDSRSLRPPHET